MYVTDKNSAKKHYFLKSKLAQPLLHATFLTVIYYL